LITSEVNFSTLSDEGITPDYFIDNEVNAYSFIREFILDYGTYPRVETVARHLGDQLTFDGLTDEPVAYWVEEVKERKRYKDIREGMARVREHLESGRVEGAIDVIGSSYLALRESYSTKRMVDLREVQREVIEKHDLLQRSPDIPGIPFGFPFIDTVSGGAQSGDYVVVVGQTGVGKTYLALRIGLAAHADNKNVLVLSTEMPNLQAARRALAMEGRFSTTDMKMGRMSPWARDRAIQLIDDGATFKESSGKYFYLLPGGMFPKVEDVVIVAKEMKPDLLIVDGAYLLQTTGRASWWERNMEVASMLKNLALNEDFPIIATYQYTKKETGKLEGVGGGFAIPQIASVVFSFEYERKEDIGSQNEVQYRILRLTKGRDGESGSIKVEYNMRRTTIEQIKVISGRMDPDDMTEQELERERPIDYEPVAVI
jgi:replicative DNA helicase